MLCVVREGGRVGDTLNDRYRSLSIPKDEKRIVNVTRREIKLRIQMRIRSIVKYKYVRADNKKEHLWTRVYVRREISFDGTAGIVLSILARIITLRRYYVKRTRAPTREWIHVVK